MTPNEWQPYCLSDNKLDMLRTSFTQPCPIPFMQPFQETPTPEELQRRLDMHAQAFDFRGDLGLAMLAVKHCVTNMWCDYDIGEFKPMRYMHTPIGAPYKVMVEETGRSIIATRNIKAGEFIFREYPVLIFPSIDNTINALYFTMLPQKALHDVLTLRNEIPQVNEQHHIPFYNLLEELKDILTTNTFPVPTPFGEVRILLLKGSLFTHSPEPNMIGSWEPGTERIVFWCTRDIWEGDELVHDFLRL